MTYTIVGLFASQNQSKAVSQSIESKGFKNSDYIVYVTAVSYTHLDVYKRQVDDAVDALSSLMEPIIMVVLGTLIGGMVIAMYLPIFKLGAVV